MKLEPLAPPDADEYAPHFAGYVALVRERDVLAVLRRQLPVLRSVCTGMTEREALTRYEAGKWSIKQVVGHLADTERVLAYRLLRIVRGDATPLPAYDDAAYVEAGNFERRSLPSLLRELESVRAATLRLAETVAAPEWLRQGVAGEHPVSARALLFVVVGHMEHHFELLRERYGLAIPHVEVPAS